MYQIEVWVLVDANGNAVCHVDEGKLAELYDEEIGDNSDIARRIVRVLLQVPVPGETILRGTVPPAGEAALTVAE